MTTPFVSNPYGGVYLGSPAAPSRAATSLPTAPKASINWEEAFAAERQYCDFRSQRTLESKKVEPQSTWFGGASSAISRRVQSVVGFSPPAKTPDAQSIKKQLNGAATIAAKHLDEKGQKAVESYITRLTEYVLSIPFIKSHPKTFGLVMGIAMGLLTSYIMITVQGFAAIEAGNLLNELDNYAKTIPGVGSVANMVKGLGLEKYAGKLPSMAVLVPWIGAVALSVRNKFNAAQGFIGHANRGIEWGAKLGSSTKTTTKDEESPDLFRFSTKFAYAAGPYVVCQEFLVNPNPIGKTATEAACVVRKGVERVVGKTLGSAGQSLSNTQLNKESEQTRRSIASTIYDGQNICGWVTMAFIYYEPMIAAAATLANPLVAIPVAAIAVGVLGYNWFKVRSSK